MRRLAAFLAVVVLALAVTSSSSPKRVGAAHDFSSAGAMIQAEIDDGNFPGASMIVVKDGQPVYEEYFGSFGQGTVIPIASASKWVSGAVIMSLVDDGVISLDDTAGEWLPGWTGVKGSITVRQMFSHTSGLPPDHACLSQPGITLETCVDQIYADTTMLAPPGTMFWYGSVSMQVAGRIAEVASGKSWAQLFADQLRTPLGMGSMYYWPFANPRVDGGVISTMSDYARLLQAMHQDGIFGSQQVLSVASVDAMEADQTGGVPIWYSPHFDDTRYGVGVWRDIVGPAGEAVQVSSQGRFAMSPWLDRERRYYAIFFVQDDFVELYSFVENLQVEVRGIIDGYDTDGDGQADGVDTDDDGDGQADGVDGCASTVTLWTTPTGDVDCDGFPSVATVGGRGRENFMGTDMGDRCPEGPTDDAWPPDTNNSGGSNLSDIVAFGSSFNTVGPGPPYDARFDLNGSGGVNLGDIVATGPFFNRSCGA